MARCCRIELGVGAVGQSLGVVGSWGGCNSEEIRTCVRQSHREKSIIYKDPWESWICMKPIDLPAIWLWMNFYLTNTKWSHRWDDHLPVALSPQHKTNVTTIVYQKTFLPKTFLTQPSQGALSRGIQLKYWLNMSKMFKCMSKKSRNVNFSK